MAAGSQTSGNPMNFVLGIARFSQQAHIAGTIDDDLKEFSYKDEKQSRRMEMPRIADFTNPSAGSMTWQAFQLVKYGCSWAYFQVGRLVGEAERLSPLVRVFLT
ncbi:hypothetical protein U9M48_028241 [Paspalum notatum var. saurae]|uniref:Uncharacterized protein n=1 Tax=Paspalum notatum var. saurae TaxID=547442 RepID=A0AAQ3TW34_PASNO